MKSSITITSKSFEEIQAIILLQSGKHRSVYCQIYLFGRVLHMVFSFLISFLCSNPGMAGKEECKWLA